MTDTDIEVRSGTHVVCRLSVGDTVAVYGNMIIVAHPERAPIGWTPGADGEWTSTALGSAFYFSSDTAKRSGFREIL